MFDDHVKEISAPEFLDEVHLMGMVELDQNEALEQAWAEWCEMHPEADDGEEF